MSVLGMYSSVGIVTRYGLDGPGIESQWGGGFIQTHPVVQTVSCKMGNASFPGGKAAGT